MKIVGQSPELGELIHLETNVNELKQRFATAASFIAEISENINALQKCITPVSQAADTECFEFDNARCAHIQMALLVAASDLRKTVGRLIAENARRGDGGR